MSPNIRQAPEYSRYMESLGWCVGKEKNFRFFIRKIPILGSFLKIQRPLIPVTLQTLDRLSKKYHIFAATVDYSPGKTLQLDITPSLQEILKQMKKDNRYEIRKAQKNNVIVEKSTDIEAFVKMWQKNALRRGFWIPFEKEIKCLYRSFEKNALLLMAKHNGVYVSGALVLIYKETASYFHAASTSEGRQVSSPYLVIWEAIKQTKRHGCKIFDFEGILDPRDKNTKKWGGFTHFKKGFGGSEVEFPLAKTYFYNPILRFFSKFFP